MANCSSCRSPIPDDQGSDVCSMCYGDPFHGKDGYYLNWLDQDWRHEEEYDESSQSRILPSDNVG